jgi:hypothetical protein
MNNVKQIEKNILTLHFLPCSNACFIDQHDLEKLQIPSWSLYFEVRWINGSMFSLAHNKSVLLHLKLFLTESKVYIQPI